MGLSNGKAGGLEVAINALQSVAHSHRFLGINSVGRLSVFETKGNQYAHVVLRGGSSRPNYSPAAIAQCETSLQKAEPPTHIMVDCSHANSEKDPSGQPAVTREVARQIAVENQSIMGLMLESHLEAGNGSIPEDLSALRHGVSITDGCIDWDTTDALLTELATALSARRN